MQENLSLYHIFYVTGKTGSISRAAKELYISQPAVSRAVQKLEHNLNTLLFKRNSRGVALTPDGKILFEKIQAAFELVDEGERAILHNGSRKHYWPVDPSLPGHLTSHGVRGKLPGPLRPAHSPHKPSQSDNRCSETPGHPKQYMPDNR